ncbi:MAG: hypothetical protein QNL88_02285 [Acidobacteriota bacterium]|nr:hypothetical protein [Acidobacteriota bacterium]
MNRLSSACEAKFAEALACVETTGERFWEAEIYRLRGELFQTDGDEDTAAACFQGALDVARRQGARSLELWAAVSLASAWRASGRVAEALPGVGKMLHHAAVSALMNRSCRSQTEGECLVGC